MSEVPTFDKQLQALEGIVKELESDKLDLEQAIDKFEQGMQLVKSCQGRLNEAELKIETITQSKKAQQNDDSRDTQ